jgi:general secretion pathway protein C
MSLPYAPARWPAATATTLLWALAAASVVFWGLRLAAPPDALTPPVPSTPAAPLDPAAIARLLGAQAPRETVVVAPELASRFVLLGVVADTAGKGAALIAVDGKPPRPYRVGTTLADGYVLRSLDARAATVGASTSGPAALTLQLPARPFAPNPPRGSVTAPS